MKKLIMLYCALQCIFLTACWHNGRNISFHYKDNNNSYSMDAWFGRSKTRRVERYMNDMIGRENNISFFNTSADAVFTLDDGSKFHMKKYPGHIMITVNKDEASDRTYHIMKDMCKGMKDVVLK